MLVELACFGVNLVDNEDSAGFRVIGQEYVNLVAILPLRALEVPVGIVDGILPPVPIPIGSRTG